MKSITPAFDRLIGGGLAFGNLTVLFNFWFDEGLLMLVELGNRSMRHGAMFPDRTVFVSTLSLKVQKVYAPMPYTVVHGNTPLRCEEYYRPQLH
jgi:hypothetical protein